MFDVDSCWVWWLGKVDSGGLDTLHVKMILTGSDALLVSDIAIFVLKRDVKLQLTNQLTQMLYNNGVRKIETKGTPNEVSK